MTASVVVTGASSGIGEAAALDLAQRGYVVYAGVRGDADARRIAAAHANLRAVRLDVTDANAIAAAVQTVESGGVQLLGIVNNAGIAVAGPLEFLPLDDLRRQFEVNVFGALAVTQAFLPLLRARGSGRVVFVGSISGRLTPPLLGPYSSSKHALRAAANALRYELAPARIRVALIEPGSVKTPIWAKGRAASDEMLARLPAAAEAPYGASLRNLVTVTEVEERNGMPVGVVVDAIRHALLDPKPKASYLLGFPARAGAIVGAIPALRDRLFARMMVMGPEPPAKT
jgi:NAD(P)-dependent dehydrogenase (short-subunit alcohol dehydrogenase family)